MDGLTDEVLDKPIEVTLCRSYETGQCLYINDHRIVGGKPDYRGKNLIWEKQTTLRQVIRSFPQLQNALGFDYLGNRLETKQDG